MSNHRETSNHAGRARDPGRGKKARDPAPRAEIDRLQGNYTAAIMTFTRALGKRGSRQREAWILAHRGATWAALGNLERACDDFVAALAIRPEYAWAYAQMGEAFRIFARNQISSIRSADLQICVSHALGCFDCAEELGSESDAWVHAHKGALYGLAYWHAIDMPIIYDSDAIGPTDGDLSFLTRMKDSIPSAPMPRDPEEIYKAGEAAFSTASALNPTYPWALAFHAFLRVLHRDYESAIPLLEKAQLYDVNKRLLMLRGISKLQSYIGRNRDALLSSAQALQLDPFDPVSQYFNTISLVRLVDSAASHISPVEDGESAGPLRDVAKELKHSMIEGTIRFLEAQRSVFLAMEVSLYEVKGDREGAARVGAEMFKLRPDLEAIAMLMHVHNIKQSQKHLESQLPPATSPAEMQATIQEHRRKLQHERLLALLGRKDQAAGTPNSGEE